MNLKFVISDKVQPKQSTQFGSPFGKQRAFKPNKIVKFEDHVKLCFRMAYPNWDYRNFEGKALRINIKSFRPLLKGFNPQQQKQAMQGIIRPITRPDTDNISKGVKDALNELAYPDDSQVVCEIIQKFYAKEHYTVVEIREA